ncbi:MAG: beta strand repeat-containing protein, partial [Aquabacterium sp.]
MSSIRPTVRSRVALAGQRRRGRQPALHRIGLAAVLVLSGAPAWTLPTGANTVAGQVSVSNQGPNAQTINQGSQKAIIDWQSFSIGAGERVNIIQPSAQATLLNRVIGYDPSRILGQMQSNGRVFLVNPYGIVFGAGARIDVGGLVASTLDIGNTDFMAGRFSLTANGQTESSIVNEGVITTRAGTVVMVAPQVSNSGTIEANGGRIGLAAANNALVDLDGDGLVFLSVDGNQATNRLNQVGRLQADAGSIELRAAARAAMADTVLNLEGVVQARSMGLRNGRVFIDGGDSGITNVNGTVDVSGRAAGERGGDARLLGHNVMLNDAAVVDAAGSTGGGTVLVGGNWQGQGPERNADQTIMRSKASIDASATDMGDGGTVVLWADDRTQFHGAIRSTGGANGGNGGKVETSGKRVLRAFGEVNVGAPMGQGGQWLLDPNDLTISAAGDSKINAGPDFKTSNDNAILNTTTLKNALTNGANVTVLTQSKGSDAQSGDIFVDGAITTALAGGQTASLSLQAQRNIEFKTNSSLSAGAGTLNLTLHGGTKDDGTNPGTNASTLTIAANVTINTGGGGLTIVNKGTASLAGLTVGDTSITTIGGTLSQVGAITINGNATINTGAGDILLITPANVIAGNASLTGSAVSVQTSGVLTVTTLAATANKAVSLVAGGLLTLPAAAIDTGTAALTLSSGTTLTTVNNLSGSNVALTGTNGISLGHIVTATGTLGLNATNSTINQTANKIVATGGATTVNAGNGTVTLDQATNDFLSIGINTAGTATVRDANAIQLNTSQLTNLTLTATDAVTQNGAVVATGTVSVATATDKNVTLTDLGNNFATFAVTAGQTVKVTDSNGIVLGASTVKSLELTAGGDVTQSGIVKATNASTITATGNSITLATAGNELTDVSLAAKNVDVRSGVAMTVTALTQPGNGNVRLESTGALTLPAADITTTGNITLASAGNFGLPGALSGADVSITGVGGVKVDNNITASGALALSTTNSAIVQTAGKLIEATGTTTVTAGSGNVTLDDAGNKFGTFAVVSGKDVLVKDANSIDLGAITTTGTLTVVGTAGAITTSGAVSGTDVSLTGATGITLSQNLAATATLGLNTTNSAVNQTAGKVTATGATTVAAGTGDVTLAQATNDFSSITVTGGAVSLQDTNALTVTALTAGANKSVSVVAGGALTLPATAIATGTADLTLSSGTTLTTPGNLSGTNISLTGATGLTLANDVTAAGTLGLNTTNSLVDQTAGTVSATGKATV